MPKKKNVRPPERKRKKDHEKVSKPEPGLESEQLGPEWEPVPELVHEPIPEPVHEPQSELEKQDIGDESSQGKQWRYKKNHNFRVIYICFFIWF